MAWQERNGKRYYYRSKRRGGQVVTEYAGTGSAGESEALLDELERARQEAERAEWQRQIEADAALDQEIAEYALAVRRTVAAVLLASGYHRPKRQWRLRRMQSGQ